VLSPLSPVDSRPGNHASLRRLAAIVGAVACCALSVSTLAAEPAPPAEPLPDGLWELANAHELPFAARTLTAGRDVVIISDLATQIAGVRPDSGLVVWRRKATGLALRGGPWLLPGGSGGSGGRGDPKDAEVVVVAGDALTAWRADVGARLWERDLGCQGDLCAERVALASDAGLYLAVGGVVQDGLMRLDPTSGAPLWAKPARVGHPRKVLANGPPSVDRQGLLVVEDGQAPFTVHFLDPVDGRELGTWTRAKDPVTGLARPPSELLVRADGRVAAVELRPTEGLAEVTLIGRDGTELTERAVPRPAGVTSMPVRALLTADGLAIVTPSPEAGLALVTTMLLDKPWTARTERVKSWADPLMTASGLVFPPSIGADPVWSASGSSRWSRSLPGVDGASGRTSTFVIGARLVALESADARSRASGLVTVDATSGRVQGIGAPDLALPSDAADPKASTRQGIDLAAAFGDELVLARRSTLYRVVLVPWNTALERLRSAKDGGGDLRPLLGRLARFGAAARALADAVGESLPGGPVPEPGPSTRPPDATNGPTAASANSPPSTASTTGAAAAPTATLAAADLALIDALREAWRGGDAKGALEGMLALVDQAPAARRGPLLDAFADLVLDLVLAPGLAPRGDAAESLVALGRALESAARTSSVSRRSAVIFAATMALIDEPLAGADLLVQVAPDPMTSAARGELARRALFQLHRSAGPLKTDTSRQMLVGGLRFFRHLDELAAAHAAEVQALLDTAATDPGAARRLDSLLTTLEGPSASRKGSGPALCRVACEVVRDRCDLGDTPTRPCEERCGKGGAVRFSPAARPGADGSWLCR